MKSWIIALSILSYSVAAAVEAPGGNTTSSGLYANTIAGHFALTGDLSIGYGSVVGFFGSVQPQLEYFVVDRLSLGAATEFHYAAGKQFRYMAIGPSATYHFWNYGQFSSYAGVSGYLFNTHSDSVNSYSGSLGANYNFSPSFGAGPKLTYTYYSSDYEYNSRLRGEVGLYLYF